MIAWHRLFGMALTDLLRDTGWEVVTEVDLSVKQQRLDIVVVRRGNAVQPVDLPDGFGPLADHNLLTFKSLREPLDGWAVKELVGHSVNYRKQISPSLSRLLPEKKFRLFAVCTRFPKKLASQVTLEAIGSGVYDVPWGVDRIRILVLSEIPPDDHNAVLNLFSADPTRVEFGSERYCHRTTEVSSLFNQLFNKYQNEGLIMPYTWDQFVEDSTREIVAKALPEVRLAGMTPDQRLAGMTPDQRLAGMTPDQRLAGMTPDELRVALALAERQLKATGKRPARNRPKRSSNPRRGQKG